MNSMMIKKKRIYKNTKNKLKKKYDRIKLIKNSLKLFLLLILSLIILIKKKAKNDDKNFICFCMLAKKENLYIRDLVSYHKNIGFDKFILVDNNYPNEERLSDVLQDFIKNNTVTILNYRGISINQGLTYQYIYNNYKDKCQWLNFFDSDEYLVLYPENGKNITIQEFLNNPRYAHCESILINWLMYDDNDLLHYDNRPLNIRFTRADKNYRSNIYVKSITRGGLQKTLFGFDKSSHFPSNELILCDSSGRTSQHYSDVINPPVFEYAQVSHFSTKSTEEFINKMKRGYPGEHFSKKEDGVKLYFALNKFTQEKLKLFEDTFNQTFSQFR